MSDNTTTPYSNKLAILAELWMNHRQDLEMKDFVEYNDLGLPLAYAIAENVVKTTEMAQRFVEETFDLLIAGLGLEDENWDSLESMLSKSEGFDNEAD
jgi:hypothetical protein